MSLAVTASGFRPDTFLPLDLHKCLINNHSPQTPPPPLHTRSLSETRTKFSLASRRHCLWEGVRNTFSFHLTCMVYSIFFFDLDDCAKEKSETISRKFWFHRQNGTAKTFLLFLCICEALEIKLCVFMKTCFIELPWKLWAQGNRVLAEQF